jgi:hypothetical protein
MIEWLVSRGEIPKEVKSSTEVIIVTGVDALGRSHDARQLDEALIRVTNTLGPQVLMSTVNVPQVIQRVFDTSDVDSSGLLKSSEDIQQETQEAQQQALAEKAAGPTVNAAAKVMTSNVQ